MTKRPLLVLAAASGVLFGCERTPPPAPFKPVVDMKLLMQAVFDPNADVIWKAVGTIITEEGTHQRKPDTEQQWRAVRNSAVTLAEAGNLLMMEPPAEDSEEWVNAAQMLVAVSKETIKAAEAKDGDRLFSLGGDIWAACTNCHQKYIPEIRDANK